MGGCSSNNKSLGLHKTTEVPGLKIAVVGDLGTGKSCVLARYIHNQFSPIYIPTVKVVIENHVRKLNVPSHATVPISFWDIPGHEDLPLHQSYFCNLDAVIVVVDASDISGIESGKLWRDTVLSAATFSNKNNEMKGVDCEEDVTRNDDSNEPMNKVDTIPFLLLGNKSDLVSNLDNEDTVISEHDNQNVTINEPRSLLMKALTEVERNGFIGSVMVSAKINDLSVHCAIQNFLRQILERKHHLDRKWLASEKKVKEKRQRYTFKPSLKKICIDEIDKEFETADVVIHRVKSLHLYQTDCFNKFAQQCVDIGVITTTKEASLQNCLVALRDKMVSLNLKLKLNLQDDFYTLDVQAKQEDAELDKNIRYTIKTFNKEYSVVTKAILAEYPKAQERLGLVDARVERMCERHGIVTPDPDKPDPSPNIDPSQTPELVEKNRAVILHVLHECHDRLAYINRSIKQAKAAFVW